MPVFLVETGDGDPLSTSYADVSEADDYLSLTPSASSSLWTTLTVPEKEKFLMYSTRLLDQTVVFNGEPAVAGQKLRWPRYMACDCDNKEIDKTVIPDAIKAATIEIADFYSRYTTIVPYATVDDQAAIESIKVDVISIKWKKDIPAVSEQNKYPWYIENVLNCLGVIRFRGGMLHRGSRFKPVV
jgi:hypothetical protein